MVKIIHRSVDDDLRGYSRIKANEYESVVSQLAEKMTVIPTPTPTGFTWQDHPLNSKIFRDVYGNYKTSYDVAVNKIEGKTYYVNQSTGNNSNDGLTPATPLKTMLAAYNKSDIKVMVLCTRRVYWENSMQGTHINKSITIRGLFGAKPVISNHRQISWSKTATYNYVYQATRTSPYTVIDIDRQDADGIFFELKKVNSISECDATADTYYINGTTVYVHVSGNGSPSYSVFVPETSEFALISTFTNGGTLYLENLHIVGGFLNNANANVYAKNCSFQYCGVGGGYRNSAGSSIVQNCVAGKNVQDGFSYDDQIKAIEIDCVGIKNGNSLAGTSNGSTSHMGSKVIRINGQYNNNYGPNVADVQDNTESWNVGCYAHTSLTTETTQNADFQCVDGSPKMFLEGCKSLNRTSNNSVFLKDNANIFIKNCVLENWEIYTGATGSIKEF